MSHEITEIQKQHILGLDVLETNFYRSAPRLDSKYNRTVVFGISDAGASNYLLAALPTLNQQETVNYLIAATNVGRNQLEKRHRDLELERVMSFNPSVTLVNLESSLWVAGHSVDGHLEQIFSYLGKTNHTPSVWFEDMPPFLAFYKRHLAAEGKLIIPDYVFTVSETASKQEVDLIPKFEGKTEVIGNPDFDKFKNEDIPGTRERVRREMGIGDDEKLIVYMATKSLSAVAAARALANGVNELGLENYRIAFRIHPQEAKDPLISSAYKSIALTLGDHVIGAQQYKTDEIGMAASLVVTDTSTEGQAAVFRRIPTLSILIPRLMRLRDEWKQQLPPDPAITLDGSSAVVRSDGEITPTLRRVLYDSTYQNELENNMNAWSVDGRATERFVNRITELAGAV